MARIGNRNHRPELVASAAKLLSNLQVTDVTDAELLLQTAYAFDQLGDEAGAETRYRQVLTLDASRTIAAANLGAILVKRGEYAQAASWLESALARNPGAVEIRLNLAVAWLRQGRLREARAALVEALRFNPNRQEVVRLLKALPEQ